MTSPNLFTRRRALKRMIALLGGTLTAGQLGLVARSMAATSAESTPRFLGEEQFLMLERIADLIVPETDTPGAVAARVHYFIDLMLAEWASTATKQRYAAGLADIDRRAREAGSESFYAASAARQLNVLRALDDEAFAGDGRDTFFGELKKMVLFGYYSSETGATVELRFQRIPGDYRPCLPMDEIGRAWFWNGFSYDL